MDNCSYLYRGTGRGRGRGQGRGRGGRGASSHVSFHESADQTIFYYPRPDGIAPSASLIDGFRDSIKLIGHYSEDSEGNFNNDRSNLSFLDTQYLPDEGTKEKNVKLDLTVAEGEGENYSGNPKNAFHNFLKWILNNTEIFKEFERGTNESGATHSEAGSEKNGSRFVFMKNCLSKILTTPYMFMSELKIYASFIDGTVYLLNEKTSIDQQFNVHPQISLWAHKFQQYMTGGDEDERVVCNQNFRCILTSNLGPHKLFYSSSTDCANPDLYDDDVEDLSSFVSLKCIKEALNEKQQLTLAKYKMINWYLENLTTGVPKVLVGYRNDDGKVERLQLYEQDDLLRHGRSHWDPLVCISFASEFLSYVKKRAESKPKSVFVFTKKCGEAFIKSDVDANYGPVLPEWFLGDLRSEDDN